jgi:hypothetical protein
MILPEDDRDGSSYEQGQKLTAIKDPLTYVSVYVATIV